MREKLLVCGMVLSLVAPLGSQVVEASPYRDGYDNYDPNSPITWNQGESPNGNTLKYPYVDEEFPRKGGDGSGNSTNKTYGSSSCGAHTAASLLLKSGYAEKGYTAFDVGHWFSSSALRAFNQEAGLLPGNADAKATGFWAGGASYWKVGQEGRSAHDRITPLKRFRHAFDDEPYVSNLIGDRATRWHSETMPNTRLKPGENSDIEENKNELYLVHRATYKGDPNVDKQQVLSEPAKKWIKEQLDKGRFITISVPNHVFMVDGIEESTGRILVLESGGGFKYLDDCLIHFRGSESDNGFKINGLTAYEAAGISSKQVKPLWDGGTVDQVKAQVDQNIKKTEPTAISTVDWALEADSNQTSTKRQGTPGLAFTNPDGERSSLVYKKGKAAIKGYAPISVPYGRKEEPDVNLSPGEERKGQPGKKGLADPKDPLNVKEEPQDEIIYYGPAEVDFETERKPNVEMAVGAPDKVTQEGQKGRKDREGNLLVPVKNKVIEYSPAAIEFDKTERAVLDLAPGEERIAQAGKIGRKAENGDVLVEPITEITEYGALAIDYEVEHIPDVNLEPGADPIIDVKGEVGRKDKDGNVLKEPVTEKVRYAPDVIPFKTERQAVLDLAPGEERVKVKGKVGRKDEQGRKLTDPVTEVIEYGAEEIPYEVEYVPSMELEEGKEEITKPGVVGRIDASGVVLKEPETQVVLYGAGRIAFETTYNPKEDLKAGEEKIITEGQEGFKDREGNVLKESVTQVVDYGPGRVPFETIYKVDETMALDASDETKVEGVEGLLDREGNVLREKVDQVVHYAPIAIDIEEKIEEDPTLAKGTVEIAQEGEVGLQDREGNVLREMKPRIIKHGTKEVSKEPGDNDIAVPTPTDPVPGIIDYERRNPKDTATEKYITNDTEKWLIANGLAKVTENGLYSTEDPSVRYIVLENSRLIDARQADDDVENDIIKTSDGRYLPKWIVDKEIKSGKLPKDGHVYAFDGTTPYKQGDKAGQAKVTQAAAKKVAEDLEKAIESSKGQVSDKTLDKAKTEKAHLDKKKEGIVQTGYEQAPYLGLISLGGLSGVVAWIKRKFKK